MSRSEGMTPISTSGSEYRISYLTTGSGFRYTDHMAGIPEPTLEPVVDEVVVTQSTSERALDADELAAQAVTVLGADRVLVETDLGTAVETARESAADRAGAVVVTGSITLLGDVIGHARESGWLQRPDARRQAATVQLDAPELDAELEEEQ